MILSLMVLAIVLSLSVGVGYLVTRPLRLGDAPAFSAPGQESRAVTQRLPRTWETPDNAA